MRFRKIITNNGEQGTKKIKPGITLIELLMAMAIMSIAMVLIFGIYQFSVKTSKEAEFNSKNQFEVRMAADFITKELRYAASAQVLNNAPAASSGYYDIYVQNTNGSIIFNKNGVPTTPPGLNNVTDFTLTFSSTNNIISFTIGKAGNTKYDINSKVVMLNIPSTTSLNFTSSSMGIRYTRQP
jgi:prepilin-type N-terminal cleavage/methylation domain-containing protein